MRTRRRRTPTTRPCCGRRRLSSCGSPERALEIAEALPAYGVIADALTTKSLVLATNGRYEEADALLNHAIALGREHDLGPQLLRTFNNFCAYRWSAGRFAEIEAAAREG